MISLVAAHHIRAFAVPANEDAQTRQPVPSSHQVEVCLNRGRAFALVRSRRGAGLASGLRPSDRGSVPSAIVWMIFGERNASGTRRRIWRSARPSAEAISWNDAVFPDCASFGRKVSFQSLLGHVRQV